MFNQVLVSSFFNFLLPFNSLILIRYQRVDLAFHCHRTFYFVSYRIIRIGSDIRVLITQFQCGKVAFHIFDGLVLNDSFFIFAFSFSFHSQPALKHCANPQNISFCQKSEFRPRQKKCAAHSKQDLPRRSTLLPLYSLWSIPLPSVV